jgi:hypothetical protein
MSVVSVRIKTSTTKKRNRKMNVTVINNEDTAITYGYAPEHYDGVVAFYADLQSKGEIQSFTVEA